MKRLWEDDVPCVDADVIWQNVHYWVEFDLLGRTFSLEIPRWLFVMIKKEK